MVRLFFEGITIFPKCAFPEEALAVAAFLLIMRSCFASQKAWHYGRSYIFTLTMAFSSEALFLYHRKFNGLTWSDLDPRLAPELRPLWGFTGIFMGIFNYLRTSPEPRNRCLKILRFSQCLSKAVVSLLSGLKIDRNVHQLQKCKCNGHRIYK